MKKMAMLGALTFLIASASACATHAAVVSQEKNAYVVKTQPFGSNMYHCTVSQNKPVCAQVEEGE